MLVRDATGRRVSRRALMAAGTALVAEATVAGLPQPRREGRALAASQDTTDGPIGGPSRGALWVQLPNHGGAGRLAPDFGDMFTARSDEWVEARRSIAVWVLRMSSLLGPGSISDTVLGETFLPRLNEWGITLAVNVTGATLAGCGSGLRPVNEAAAIERLFDLGGHVSALSLQSPLSKSGGRECPAYGRETGYERRITDIVDYAAFMTDRFPGIEIGIVDAMPAKGWDYPGVYRELVAALTARGMGLAFLHLDCPAESASPGWENVLQVEGLVREELGVPFGLLYVSKVGGEVSNVAFRDAVLAAYRAYREAGGRPDHLELTSWYRYPDANLPEDDEGRAPFMNLVRNFARLGGVMNSATEIAG
jgi:hypothetical protein